MDEVKTEAAAAPKTAKAKRINESWEEMQQRQKEERKALRKQMADDQKKENKKFTTKMVAAVRAYHKGMSDQAIMEHYQALLQEQKPQA